MFANINWADIGQASLDTGVMLAGSLGFSVLLGLPLGVILFLTGKGRLLENGPAHGALSFAVNVLRSVPFVILLIVMIPLTMLLVGTSLGVAGAIPPLVVGAAPFYARLVETALREVDKGKVEAAEAMGATHGDIVRKVLLPEALPALLAGTTLTLVMFVDYSAMAGAIGAGGLGSFAIKYGYQRFNTELMLVTVAILVLIVQAIQLGGEAVVRRVARRR